MCKKFYTLSRTRQSYVGAVKGLADFHQRSPAELGEEELRQFFLHLIVTRKVAKSTVTVYLSGIKFFCEKTLGRPMPVLDLVRPKKRRKLPCVLTIEEIKLILAGVRQPRIRMLLAMVYSCGLRLSEATHLRPGDVDMARMQVKVTGKGGKDRYVPLAKRSKQLLEDYLKEPQGFGCLPTSRGEPPARTAPSKGLFGPPCAKAISTNSPRFIPCAIPTLPTFWKTGSISESSRPLLVTNTPQRPWFMPT